MPRLIEASDTQSCSLEEAIEGIAQSQFDSGCDDSLQEAALWLRRLNNNRSFLGDLLIERLKTQFRDTGIDSGYGPQAIVLSPLRDGVFLRANIWPSERDHCFKSSGAKTFVYDVPHDHNFSFLTSGYLGPGYRSDYFENDYGAASGYAGERPGLKFIERSTLHQDKLMLYRAHLDIHNQIPPESLSVSLNVMHVDPVQSWFDQYGFDLNDGSITRVLSPNATEVFLRTAVATGQEEALDLAERFGRSHPSDRLRLASYEARALLKGDSQTRDDVWREAELSGCRMLGECAKVKRAEIAAA